MNNRRHCTVSEGHFIRGMKLRLPQAGKQISPHKGGWSTSQKTKHQSQQWMFSGPQRLWPQWVWGGEEWCPFSRSRKECKQHFFNVTKQMCWGSFGEDSGSFCFLSLIDGSYWKPPIVHLSWSASERILTLPWTFSCPIDEWVVWNSGIVLLPLSTLSPSSRPPLSRHPKAQCCAASGRAPLPRSGLPPGFLTPVPVPVLAGSLPWTSASLARALTAWLVLSHHPVLLSNRPASCFNLDSPWPSTTPFSWPPIR